MHKLNTNSHSRKILISIVVGLVAIVVICGVCWVFTGKIFGWSPFAQVTTQDSSYNSPATDEQVKNGQQIKENSVANNDNAKGTSGGDQPEQPSPQPNGKSTVGIDITSTNQAESSLQIRTLISTIDNGGTCTLTLQKAGHATVTKSSNAQNLSNTSTCQGFDVPLSELSAGSWQITLLYQSSTLTGTTSATVVVK